MGFRFLFCALLFAVAPNWSVASVQFDIGSNGALNSAAGNRFVIGSGYGADNSNENGSNGNLLDVVFTINAGLPTLAPFTLSPTQFSTFTFGTITFQEPDTGTGTNQGIRSGEVDNLGVTAFLTFILPPLTPDASIATVGVPVLGVINDTGVDFSITFPTVPVNFGTGSTGFFTLALSSVSFTSTPQSKDVIGTLTLVNEPVTTPPGGGTLAAPEATSLAVWTLLAAIGGVAIKRRR